LPQLPARRLPSAHAADRFFADIVTWPSFRRGQPPRTMSVAAPALGLRRRGYRSSRTPEKPRIIIAQFRFGHGGPEMVMTPGSFPTKETEDATNMHVVGPVEKISNEKMPLVVMSVPCASTTIWRFKEVVFGRLRHVKRCGGQSGHLASIVYQSSRGVVADQRVDLVAALGIAHLSSSSARQIECLAVEGESYASHPRLAPTMTMAHTAAGRLP